MRTSARRRRRRRRAAFVRPPPARSGHGHAFLRLVPPAAAAGATLRLVAREEEAAGPGPDDAAEETAPPDDAETEEVPLRLPPALLTVLLAGGGSGSGTAADGAPSPDASDRAVAVRVMADDRGGAPRPGRLARCDVDAADRLDDDAAAAAADRRATVRLSYVCSTSAAGRRRFDGRPGVDDRDRTSRHPHPHRDGGREAWLARRLAGEVIVAGGIVALDVSPQDQDEPYAVADDAGGEPEEERHAVFFLVEELRVADGGAAAPDRAARCLRLWPPGRFDVALLAPPADARDADAAEPRREAEEEDAASCPGYESTLEELLALARVEDPAGAPAAVVLAGCAGVGKSRMVRASAAAACYPCWRPWLA